MTGWEAPARLDRAEDRRGDAQWVAELWTDPAAQVLAATGDGGLAWADGGLVLAPAAGPLSDRHLLLGLLDGAPLFLELVPDLPGAQPLRTVMEGLDEAGLEVAFTASGLAGWHRQARFCSRCGAATAPVRGGLARRCPNCERESYPRVDPAVIVAITDPEDRLLLGRQAVWAPGRMSVFAGFTEVGESLEQAVYREVHEEVGLRVSGLRYLGSQPWPFPRSLMVGFSAQVSDTELVVDTTEIEQARWFSRDELDAALAAGEVILPATTSIAHRMIRRWRTAVPSGHR